MTFFIECHQCHRAFSATTLRRIYCPRCSEARTVERKAAFQRAHPPAAEIVRERSRRLLVQATEAGKVLSSAEREPIAWWATEPIDLLWSVRIATPFAYEMSKNKMLSWTKSRRPHLTKEHRSIRDQIRDRLALIFNRPDAPKVVQAKLWLDIYVQKPDNRGDAVNVVDIVCDAVKQGIGLDDRWFSVRRLDWQISKQHPMLYLGLGQDTDQDHQACSSCGRVLLLEAFAKGSATSHKGRGRNCRECLSEGRKLTRGAKK